MREWIAKNILGLVRAPEARKLDIFAELANGKSILLDSGLHSPMQDYIRRICASAEYIDKPTIELWHSLFPVEAYLQHAGRFKLSKDRTLSGDNLIHASNKIGKWHDHTEKSKIRNLRKQIETIKSAMRSEKKTIAQIDSMRYEERVIEAIVETAEELWVKEHNMPLFVIQFLQRYKNEYVFELIKRLQQIAPTVIIRVVEAPMPITPSLTADIHIVERTDFQKYLRSDAEVLLANNQRAVITSHHEAREFTKWDYKSYKFEDTPTVAEYNASFFSKSARKAFTDKHWERCHN